MSATCTPLVGGGSICGEEMREVRREPDGAERWCYHCRTRRPFDFVVRAPVGPSWYDPNPGVECATCHLRDGDLFPGRYREWEE